MAGIRQGATGSARLEVTERDTALAHGSGDLAVLATPRLVALLEEAACAALAGTMDEGETSVGVSIEVDHLSATPVGGSAVARARLVGVEGRHLDFALEAEDGRGPIARGRHRRVIVDRERFLARLGQCPTA